MDTLRQKQSKFVLMVAQLIEWTYQQGYQLTWGETLRSASEAKWNAQQGIGIQRSLHMIGLAVDLNLFIDGVWQRDSAAYERLGVYWESLGGSWGGRFSKPDGNHFSLEHEGVR